ncbi:hypothetical protein I302_106461 [Kwoniella bestiolae CBS 10118]|uniref:Uncharacterized protein n=1 Tax=Kwoniella bestiolae CBS 10118 TaxID=1296100 RepID=A0A1B9G1D5_9TREE|nr:hypothetical protein I302_06282 [Kwoniella bestiolae CBS 10118]OCF24821.1 hypothetical protein I302_06282 [Kwoniella bestiolae CBS 10118]
MVQRLTRAPLSIFTQSTGPEAAYVLSDDDEKNLGVYGKQTDGDTYRTSSRRTASIRVGGDTWERESTTPSSGTLTPMDIDSERPKSPSSFSTSSTLLGPGTRAPSVVSDMSRADTLIGSETASVNEQITKGLKATTTTTTTETTKTTKTTTTTEST